MPGAVEESVRVFRERNPKPGLSLEAALERPAALGWGMLGAARGVNNAG